jgi:hypothetical protein
MSLLATFRLIAAAADDVPVNCTLSNPPDRRLGTPGSEKQFLDIGNGSDLGGLSIRRTGSAMVGSAQIGGAGGVV